MSREIPFLQNWGITKGYHFAVLYVEVSYRTYSPHTADCRDFGELRLHATWIWFYGYWITDIGIDWLYCDIISLHWILMQEGSVSSLHEQKRLGQTLAWKGDEICRKIYIYLPHPCRHIPKIKGYTKDLMMISMFIIPYKLSDLDLQNSWKPWTGHLAGPETGFQDLSFYSAPLEWTTCGEPL